MASLNLPNLNQIAAYVQSKTSFANPNAAIALASVAGAESGGNPGIVNTTGTAQSSATGAMGLFQDYSPSRQAGLLAATQGDLSNINAQVGYAVSEIQSGGYPKTLAVLNDPNATLAQTQQTLITEFENPGGDVNNPSTDAGSDFVRAQQYAPQITATGGTAVSNQPIDGGELTGSISEQTATDNQVASNDNSVFSDGYGSNSLGLNGQQSDTSTGQYGSLANGSFDPGFTTNNGFATSGSGDFFSFGSSQSATGVGQNLGAASDLNSLGSSSAAQGGTLPADQAQDNQQDAELAQGIDTTISGDQTAAVTSNTATPAASVPQAITNAATAQDKTATADTKSTIAAGTGIVANVETYFSALSIRVVVITLGLVFIIGGIFLFPRQTEEVGGAIKKAFV